jgi:hypothetical protein
MKPYRTQTDAAIRAPRSRRDKAMSDYKAINKTNQGFSGGGILHITRQSRPIYLFPMLFTTK